MKHIPNKQAFTTITFYFATIYTQHWMLKVVSMELKVDNNYCRHVATALANSFEIVVNVYVLIAITEMIDSKLRNFLKPCSGAQVDCGFLCYVAQNHVSTSMLVSNEHFEIDGESHFSYRVKNFVCKKI